MNYIQMAGIMESCERNQIHRQHIREFIELVEQMIKELVPQLIKEEIEKIYDVLVAIKTQINGKDVDFPDVRDYILEQIAKELKGR